MGPKKSGYAQHSINTRAMGIRYSTRICLSINIMKSLLVSGGVHKLFKEGKGIIYLTLFAEVAHNAVFIRLNMTPL